MVYNAGEFARCPVSIAKNISSDYTITRKNLF